MQFHHVAARKEETTHWLVGGGVDVSCNQLRAILYITI